MKRALIVLLLLAVVAGGLFAQQTIEDRVTALEGNRVRGGAGGLTFSGHVQSGVGVSIPNEGDTTFQWQSADGGNWRFQLGTSFAHPSGRAGAFAGIRRDGNADNFTIYDPSAWVEPIKNDGGTLRLQAGAVGPGGFGTPGSLDASNDAASVGGLNVRYTPNLDGATFSIGAGFAPRNDGGDTAADRVFDKARYTAGVSFGLPSLLSVVANLSYNGFNEQTNVAAGVRVLALDAAGGVSGLTRLAVDVTANNISDLVSVSIGPRVEFRVANVTGAGHLTGNFQTRIFVPMTDANELDYWVGLGLGLPLTPTATFNLSAGYEGNSGNMTAAGNGRVGTADWGGTGRAIGGSGDPGFVVRPSVTFNVGGGNFVTTGWSLQAMLADEVRIQNSIYAWFNVGF